MDNRLQATFMPRQAPGANDGYVRPKGPLNFLMAIAFVVILLVGGAWGALYFYKGQLVTSNEQKRTEIEDAIKSFDPELTKELTVLKARIDAGKTLLGKHTAFSEFLELLSTNTVQTVRFNSLAYMTKDDGSVGIALKGQSSTYNAIAFQSDVFSKVSQIQEPVFSNLVLDDKGIITFTVEAGLDPQTVSYARMFENVPVLPSPVTTSSATTSSSTPAVRTGTTTSSNPN